MSSLYVKGIEGANFGPYKGPFRLALGEGVHAVVARHEEDDDRSNWIGKSWFLSMFPFALFGWHMARTEDEFITNGTPLASLKVHLSNGATIMRSRRRGKTTQVTFTPSGGMPLSGDAAEHEIAEMLGMSERDYFATSFAKQKEISTIVTGLPSARMLMVREWLELGPLEQSENAAWAKAVQLQESLNKLSEPEKAFDAFWARMALEGIEDEPALTAAIAAAKEEQAKCEGEVAQLVEVKARLDNAAAVQKAGEQFKAADAEGRALRADLDLMLVVTDDQLKAAKAELDRLSGEYEPARRDALRAGTAARGEFDGLCPVGGIACPAKDQINASTEAGRTHLKVVTDHAVELKVQRDAAQAAHTALTEARLKRDRTSARLDGLRQQATQLLELSKSALALESWAAAGTPEEALEGARMRSRAAAGKTAGLEASAKERGRLVAALASPAAIADAKRAVTAARATAKIWHKAQQLVSEGAVEAMGRGSNLALVEASIDLRVNVSWAREGDGLALACGECGAPFPKSQKVKECAWCGAKRGPKLTERLDILPSDRSGAADDLAGICFRLSASAWLRARKNIQWASACIDEPFGALDVANRRALAAHLTTMLGGRYGFVQSFVVAHDRAITDGLPKRIELIGTREGTRIG